MSKKFYRRVFKVEVLSEESIDDNLDLDEINYMITEGHCSGSVSAAPEEVVDGAAAAKLLLAQESDPSFFGLDDDGNEVDE